MIKYFIVFISLVLEFILINLLGYSFNNLSFIYPMLVVTSVVAVYPLFNNSHEYNYFVIILAIIYGVIFLNNIFLAVTIFVVIRKLVEALYERKKQNIWMLLLCVFLVLIMYDSSFYFILSIFNYMPFNGSFLFYKIYNSILLNLVYASLLYWVVSLSSKLR